MDTYTD